MEKFEEETGWRPAHVGLFAGALLYTHYGFIKKHIMKKIASDKGSLDTDTTRDYVYTEWDGVQRFTEDYPGRAGSGRVRSGQPSDADPGLRSRRTAGPCRRGRRA